MEIDDRALFEIVKINLKIVEPMINDWEVKAKDAEEVKRPK
jgi:hypothetical protein